MLKRRSLFASLVPFAALTPFISWGQEAAKRIFPKNPPVWTGFGLNGGSDQARYELTRAFVKKTSGFELSNSQAFNFLIKDLTNLLATQQKGKVEFKEKVEFGENLLLGFAHDYETTFGGRLEINGESANTVYIFMSGVGLILTFDKSTGWRIVSSFPFMLRMEQPGEDLKDVKAKAIGYMGAVYTSYGKAFSLMVGRFNKWDQGFSTNNFARLTKSSIHKEALEKLSLYRIQNFLNQEFIGFTTSSALCNNLDIPLLPFQENDALGKRYAVKFSNDLSAQDQISIPEADLKFEIVLRFVDKQVTVSSQKGVNIVRRKVVIRLIVIDYQETFINVLASSTGEDRMPLNTTGDDTPERDIVFFDRLIDQTLNNLLMGMVTKNESQLASVEVKLSSLAPAIPRLLKLCANTR
jgi:hypothetical protein